MTHREIPLLSQEGSFVSRSLFGIAIFLALVVLGFPLIAGILRPVRNSASNPQSLVAPAEAVKQVTARPDEVEPTPPLLQFGMPFADVERILGKPVCLLAERHYCEVTTARRQLGQKVEDLVRVFAWRLPETTVLGQGPEMCVVTRQYLLLRFSYGRLARNYCQSPSAMLQAKYATLEELGRMIDESDPNEWAPLLYCDWQREVPFGIGGMDTLAFKECPACKDRRRGAKPYSMAAQRFEL